MKNVVAVTIIILLILIGVGAGSFVLYIDMDKDTDVILDGQSEIGYESAGYLLAYKSINQINRCSGVYIQNNTFITAAHCIEKTISLYTGIGNFKVNASSNYSASSYEIDPEWRDPNSGNDLAALYLTENVPVANAVIGVPSVSCNYIVVGYGLSAEETNLPLRKSASVCITSIQNTTFRFKGQDGAICYGDSGAPVFDKVTGRVVGIVSGSILPRNTAGGESISNCSIEFEGNATRLDRKDFWEDSIDISTLGTTPIPTKPPVVYHTLTPTPTVQNTPYPTSIIPTFTPTPTFSPTTQNTVGCGKSCVNDVCSDNLKCGADKVCLPDDQAGACFLSEGEYCHPLFGIFCDENSVCRDKKCVLKVVENTTGFSIDISVEQVVFIIFVFIGTLIATLLFFRPRKRLK